MGLLSLFRKKESGEKQEKRTIPAPYFESSDVGDFYIMVNRALNENGVCDPGFECLDNALDNGMNPAFAYAYGSALERGLDPRLPIVFQRALQNGDYDLMKHAADAAGYRPSQKELLVGLGNLIAKNGNNIRLFGENAHPTAERFYDDLILKRIPFERLMDREFDDKLLEYISEELIIRYTDSGQRTVLSGKNELYDTLNFTVSKNIVGSLSRGLVSVGDVLRANLFLYYQVESVIDSYEPSAKPVESSSDYTILPPEALQQIELPPRESIHFYLAD